MQFCNGMDKMRIVLVFSRGT